jgi:uncharacterized protein (TIGR02996 family)
MRTFTLSDEKSNRFWNLELKGSSLTINQGKIGGFGRTQEKEFPDEARAKKEHDKRVAAILDKGYVETTLPGGGDPLAASLEQALVENPDDLSSHMAYADYLSEKGDPRGEFIRLQLQLEDQTLPPEERKKLQGQEKRFLRKYGRAWLGELGPFLLPAKRGQALEEVVNVEFGFARGWLDHLEATGYTVAFTRAMARTPHTRLLRTLVLTDEAYEEDGEYEVADDLPKECYFPQLYPLTRSPWLTNVRTFVLGERVSAEEEAEAEDGGFNCCTEGDAAADLIARMPRVEELHLLAHSVDADKLFSLPTLEHLRVLLLYHSNSYPLARLAKNPCLKNLTHLLLHPHALDDEKPYIRLAGVKALVHSTELPALKHLQIRLTDMGDRGVKEIISSGILKRLEVLDLQHGCITDKGARLFAGCPEARDLQRLDLTNNALTEEGAGALEQAGVNAGVESQWVPGASRDWGENEYLYAGDIE